jgi:hypothetical protein
MEDEEQYKVVCFFRDCPENQFTVESGLTLEQVQRICKDPDTSSRTTTTKEGKERTAKFGPWFYGYTKEV